jgi:flagellar motility protein MotE (MotC chaperone)
MKRLSALLLGACLILFISTDRGQGADPIGDKLEKAKAKFEQEMKKAKEMAKKYFDDREDKARKAKKDNKKLLDEVNDEKKAFEEHGLLGERAPRELKALVTTQQSLLKAAYAKAVDEYTKAKKDDLSAAVTKEWEQVKAQGLLSIAPPGELWIPLFNGIDLFGWTQAETNRDKWIVIDGAIQITNITGKPTNLLTKRGDFDNFHLRMEIMYYPNAICGIAFRYSDPGYQSVTVISGMAHTGSVARAGKKGGEFLKTAAGPSPPPKEWFTLEVIARGNTISTLVNGVKAAEAVDDEKTASKGCFNIRVDGEGSVIRFRNIKILPLPQDPKK